MFGRKTTDSRQQRQRLKQQRMDVSLIRRQDFGMRFHKAAKATLISLVMSQTFFLMTWSVFKLIAMCNPAVQTNAEPVLVNVAPPVKAVVLTEAERHCRELLQLHLVES